MRRHRDLAEAETRSKDHAEHKGTPSGRHVDDGATREVDGFDAGIRVERAAHEAVDRPDHVGQREVDDEHPDQREKEHGGEFHALRGRAEDERGSDDGEGQLEHGPHVVGDPVVACTDIARGHAGEETLRGVTDERVAAREGQAVTDRPPQDGDQTCHAQAHREDGEHVLRADQTTVEKGQAGQGHEQHERRANHLPGIVTGAGNFDFRRVAGRTIHVVEVGFDVGDTVLERRPVGRSGFLDSHGHGFRDGAFIGGDRHGFRDGGDGFLRLHRKSRDQRHRQQERPESPSCFFGHVHEWIVGVPALRPRGAPSGGRLAVGQVAGNQGEASAVPTRTRSGQTGPFPRWTVDKSRQPRTQTPWANFANASCPAATQIIS